MYVGRTLVSLLEAGLAGLVPLGNVTLSSPDVIKAAPPNPPAVTLFLYHVGIHGERRNAPRRLTPAGAVQRPPLPLDLRFLITPWTNQPHEAHQILGTIARLFYDRASLGFGELLGEDVWGPDDTVEILMESLPVEAHHDIWEPTDLPYRTSLTYLARVVGIDSALTTPAPPVAVAAFPSLTP
jgi:hypothetical protein